MMCEIAEGERKRLYYESESEKAVNSSQRASPQKGTFPRCEQNEEELELFSEKQLC